MPAKSPGLTSKMRADRGKQPRYQDVARIGIFSGVMQSVEGPPLRKPTPQKGGKLRLRLEPSSGISGLPMPERLGRED
jgi:hypothetical protein